MDIPILAVVSSTDRSAQRLHSVRRTLNKVETPSAGFPGGTVIPSICRRPLQTRTRHPLGLTHCGSHSLPAEVFSTILTGVSGPRRIRSPSPRRSSPDLPRRGCVDRVGERRAASVGMCTVWLSSGDCARRGYASGTSSPGRLAGCAARCDERPPLSVPCALSAVRKHDRFDV
jgi:hypothetical protein